MKRTKKRFKKVSTAAKFREISDYDKADTSELVDTRNPLSFESLGLQLPPTPPTQVVSIRLPSDLLNQLRAIGSEMDVPYQALVKMFLTDAVKERKKKAA